MFKSCENPFLRCEVWWGNGFLYLCRMAEEGRKGMDIDGNKLEEEVFAP